MDIRCFIMLLINKIHSLVIINRNFHITGNTRCNTHPSGPLTPSYCRGFPMEKPPPGGANNVLQEGARQAKKMECQADKKNSRKTGAKFLGNRDKAQHVGYRKKDCTIFPFHRDYFSVDNANATRRPNPATERCLTGFLPNAFYFASHDYRQLANHTQTAYRTGNHPPPEEGPAGRFEIHQKIFPQRSPPL